MEHLVSRPESVGDTDGVSDGPGGRHRGFPVRPGVGILPPDQGRLESLGQVDAVHAPLPGEDVTGKEEGRPVRRLGMQPLPQFKQPRLAGEIVQPEDDVQVVRPAPPAPVGPMVERSVGEMVRLIPEIGFQERQRPRVLRRFVILADDLQGHHLRPPVVRLPPLQAIDIGMVRGRSHIPVRLSGRKDSLHPDLRLVHQRPVLQEIRQRQQAVQPVGSPLPRIPVAAQPGIVRSDHLRIHLVQGPGQSLRLQAELFLQPAIGPDGADGKGREPGRLQRRPVEHLGL